MGVAMKAFPHLSTNRDDIAPGMDLRDYFAAKAMQGMISNIELVKGHISFAESKKLEPKDVLASDSYQVADAMMKAREQ